MHEPVHRRRDPIGVILRDEMLAAVDPIKVGTKITRQPLAVGHLLELIRRTPHDRRRQSRVASAWACHAGFDATASSGASSRALTSRTSAPD